MRKTFAILVIVMMSAIAVWGQASSSKTAPAAPTGTTAKPNNAATLATSTKPTADFQYDGGKNHLRAVSRQGPAFGVANFIGLASGTKDWRNPSKRRDEAW